MAKRYNNTSPRSRTMQLKKAVNRMVAGGSSGMTRRRSAAPVVRGEFAMRLSGAQPVVFGGPKQAQRRVEQARTSQQQQEQLNVRPDVSARIDRIVRDNADLWAALSKY